MRSIACGMMWPNHTSRNAPAISASVEQRAHALDMTLAWLARISAVRFLLRYGLCDISASLQQRTHALELAVLTHSFCKIEAGAPSSYRHIIAQGRRHAHAILIVGHRRRPCAHDDTRTSAVTASAAGRLRERCVRARAQLRLVSVMVTPSANETALTVRLTLTRDM